MESRLSLYKERNFALRERILELEGLISREQDITKGVSDDNPAAIQHTNDVVPFELSEYISLKEKCTSLEVELLSAQKKFDVVEERESHIRVMINKFRENEDHLISHSSAQISRVREEIQAQYTDQLNEITASYELEKIAMMEEINRLTRSLHSDQVSLEDVDTSISYSRQTGANTKASSRYDPDRRETNQPSYSDSSTSSRESPGHSVGRHDDSPRATESKTAIRPEVDEYSPGHGSGDDDDAPIISHNHRVSVTVADDTVDRLRRDMLQDRRRLEQAQKQISELEQLLETQRSAFRRHLSMERDVMATQSIAGSASTATIASTAAEEGPDTGATNTTDGVKAVVFPSTREQTLPGGGSDINMSERPPRDQSVQEPVSVSEVRFLPLSIPAATDKNRCRISPVILLLRIMRR